MQSIKNRRLNPHHTVDKNKVHSSVAFLPCINKVTNRIGKVLHKWKFKTAFSSGINISNILPYDKEKLNPLSINKIFEIPCFCDAVYIDETGISIDVRSIWARTLSTYWSAFKFRSCRTLWWIWTQNFFWQWICCYQISLPSLTKNTGIHSDKSLIALIT